MQWQGHDASPYFLLRCLNALYSRMALATAVGNPFRRDPERRQIESK